jgi:uncharacterized protein
VLAVRDPVLLPGLHHRPHEPVDPVDQQVQVDLTDVRGEGVQQIGRTIVQDADEGVVEEASFVGSQRPDDEGVDLVVLVDQLDQHGHDGVEDPVEVHWRTGRAVDHGPLDLFGEHDGHGVRQSGAPAEGVVEDGLGDARGCSELVERLVGAVPTDRLDRGVDEADPLLGSFCRRPAGPAPGAGRIVGGGRLHRPRMTRRMPKHFVADDPMRSHIAAMLSSVFPEGEDFFVRSVRAYRDRIDDPELAKQVKGFIGQEAIHGREHRDFNEQPRQLGYPTKAVDRLVKQGFLAFLHKTTPKSHQLAVTAALEHYTATLAETLLRDDDARAEFVTDEVAPCSPGTPSRRPSTSRWPSTCTSTCQRQRTSSGSAPCWAVHVGFLVVMTAAVTASVAKDPEGVAKLPKSLLEAAVAPVLPARRHARLLDYNRRDFHPDDHDTVELLAEWRTRYEAGIAA